MARSEAISPELRVTPFEKVSAGMISIVLGLIVVCSIVTLMYVSTRQPPRMKVIPVELIELPGGELDGSIEETLRVDSPEPERSDASPADIIADDTEISESLETMVELSENTAAPVERQFEVGLLNRGKPGSAKGTGRRPLGIGTGTGGMPREQRWFMRFNDAVPVEEYARQLEFFKIELAAWLPDGRLAYLSKLTQPAPEPRFVSSGQGEQRLHMNWQGGGRRLADEQLFKKAGINVNRETPILHFYSPELESLLVSLETSYRDRPVKQIRRTYFTIEKQGDGYEFLVTRQITFQ